MEKMSHGETESAGRPAGSSRKSFFTRNKLLIALSLLTVGIGGFFLVRYLMNDYLVYDRPLKVLTGHQKQVSAIAVSPDGRTIASGSYDKTVKLWDAASGVLKQSFDGHVDMIRAVSLSPDGRWLASGSNDGLIQLRDAATGELKYSKSFAEDILSLAFSPDGRTLAVGSSAIYLLDAASGEIRSSIPTDNYYALGVAFSPDGKTLASSARAEVKLWDAATGTLIRTFAQARDAARPIIFSPDGKTLAGADSDGKIFLWEVAGGNLKHTLSAGFVGVSIVFLPDGQLVSGGVQLSKKTDRYDGEIKLWDTASGSLTRIFAKQRQHISAIALSPDGRTLAAGNEDGTISLWRFQ